MPIYFHTENVSAQIQHKRKIRQWLSDIIENNKKIVGVINFILCTDEKLLSINRQHLKHDYYTDVITFDLSENSSAIEGDIYISIERVKENAKNLKVSRQQELNRVIVHGILHLMGYKDDADENKAIMRKAEDLFLTQLAI